MKKIFCASLILFIVTVSYGQDFPDFGNPSAEDIALQDCPFEKNAAAVILVHEAFSYPGDNTELITTHHIRIKILNEKGLDAGNISIPFYREDDFETIEHLQALTINIGAGGVTDKQKVDKSFFYKTKLDEQLGEITFAFPSVKKGSILEYQYQSRMKNYWGLRDWYFQDDLPVQLSRYHLNMIWGKQFTYKLFKRPDLEATILPERGKIFFEMKNVPTLQDEPYMDARNDNIQRVKFEVSNRFITWSSDKTLDSVSSWKNVYFHLLNGENFWPQLDRKIPGTNDVINAAALLATPEEKMKIVYDYVRDHMSWNNSYSRSAVMGVSEAWKNGSGTSGDINLILVNLLKKVNLDASPVLVSERFNGMVDTAYPYVGQFNSVFAAVVIGDKEYFLNAVDKYTPAHITPGSILNTVAFVVMEKNAGLIEISNDSLQYKEGIYLDMKITGDDILTGDVLIRSKDYARIHKKKMYNVNKDDLKKQYTDWDGTPITINGFEIDHIDNDSLPLDEKFTMSMKLNGTEDYKFLPLQLFSGFDKNPFLSDTRFSNINFGFKRAISINSTIAIPGNYSVDELPKSVRMETPDKDIIYSRQVSFNKENNTIYCNVRFEFNKSFYDSEFYPVLRELYKKLFVYLKEQVVLKKKS